MVLSKSIAGAFVVLALLTSLSGCGGSAETGTAVVANARVVRWDPPATYTDGSGFDPSSELDSFEIYVNRSGSFSQADAPSAALSAIDPATGTIATSFDLASLRDLLPPTTVHYVSVRAVSRGGLKSGFSPSGAFSL